MQHFGSKCLVEIQAGFWAGASPQSVTGSLRRYPNFLGAVLPRFSVDVRLCTRRRGRGRVRAIPRAWEGAEMDTSLALNGVTPAGVIAESLQLNSVDIKHLRRYTLGDTALEQEVLELFLGQLPQTIASLSGATTEKEWRVAAHTLKGSGRAIGAWRIARLAEHAERMSGLKNPDARAEAVSRILDAAGEARSFIRECYGIRTL